MTNRDILLWLVLGKVSTKKINALLSVYTIESLYGEFKKEKAFIELVGDNCYSLLKKYHDDNFINRCKDALTQKGIDFITIADNDYPTALNQKEVVPPPVLFYKGNKALLKKEAIAVVGTRHCSKYGKEACERIVGDLAKSGLVIVSGLATGIDAYSHSACLNAGGETIAVLGSGHDRMSPMSNFSLYCEICERGLVISEYIPSFDATKYSFPERNRIISGLSRGVLCVEAGEKSGSLITCNFALEQGRDVFCVPGNITSLSSVGTNDLIKKGAAVLVTSADDILEEYKIENTKITQKSSVIQLDKSEEKLYNTLKSGMKSLDELVLETCLNPSEVLSGLGSLQIKGLIWQPMANVYQLK